MKAFLKMRGRLGAIARTKLTVTLRWERINVVVESEAIGWIWGWKVPGEGNRKGLEVSKESGRHLSTLGGNLLLKQALESIRGREGDKGDEIDVHEEVIRALNMVAERGVRETCRLPSASRRPSWGKEKTNFPMWLEISIIITPVEKRSALRSFLYWLPAQRPLLRRHIFSLTELPRPELSDEELQ